jgi:CubicO group peptidase (beta-lactamase class C family)
VSDHGLRLDLDTPARIEKPGHDAGRRRTRGTERLTVCPPDRLDVLRSGDVDARAHHVLEARACVDEGALDDPKADARLLVGIGRRVGVAGHDRRRSRDPHVRPDADGPRIADALLERGSGRDALALHTVSLDGMEALRQVEGWPVAHVAVAVVGRTEAKHGDQGRVFSWTSVTKLATALAVLVAVEEGILELDEPAGPPGSTVRHLLAHASGLAPDDGVPIARPGALRIYSNSGFDLLALLVAERAEMPFSEYFEGVWGFELAGSAASGVRAPMSSLLVVARELLAPSRVARETLEEAAAVQFPGLEGVLPGFGRMEPNDWGLGLELKQAKRPHWTGVRNSPRTFGHFGRSGGFLWVDPEVDVALVCLTDLDFGDWSKDAWPRLADAVLAEVSGA